MQLRIDQLSPGDWVVHPEHGQTVLVVAMVVDRDGDAVVDFGDDCLVGFPGDRVERVGSLRAGARPAPVGALL